MMRKAMILLVVLLLLIAIGVGVLVFALVSPVYAEEVINIPTVINLTEEEWFQMLHDFQTNQDCYIMVSENEELFIAVVCYGPSESDALSVDTIVYNKEQQKALWIGGNVDITAEVLKILEDIGIQYPEQYIHQEERLGFDEFKLFDIGEEIHW